MPLFFQDAELLEKLKEATNTDIERHKALIASYTKALREMYSKLEKMSQDGKMNNRMN